MAVQWVCLMALALTATVSAHQLRAGRCSTPPGLDGFDRTRFFGQWKIVEVDGGINRCITQEFGPKSGSATDIEVKQDRLLAGGVQAPSVYGTLEPRENGKASEFTVEWLLSGRFSDMSYTVLNTDYDSYALVYECQNVGPARYKQGTILARPDVSLDQATISQLKEQATALGLDFSDTKKISHSECEAVSVEDAVNLFGFLNENEAEALATQQQQKEEIIP